MRPLRAAHPASSGPNYKSCSRSVPRALTEKRDHGGFRRARRDSTCDGPQRGLYRTPYAGICLSACAGRQRVPAAGTTTSGSLSPGSASLAASRSNWWSGFDLFAIFGVHSHGSSGQTTGTALESSRTFSHDPSARASRNFVFRVKRVRVAATKVNRRKETPRAQATPL